MQVGVSMSALALAAMPTWAENAEPTKPVEVVVAIPKLTTEQLETLNKLVAQLSSQDPNEAKNAALAIQAMGKPALEPLMKQLRETQDQWLRPKLRKIIRGMGGDDCPECGRG
jgi:hypothetical protein